MKYDYTALNEAIIEKVASLAGVDPDRLKKCMNNEAEFEAKEIESLAHALNMSGAQMERAFFTILDPQEGETV